MATKQPQWLDNAIFYEIYPQSFNDTNADGIGDFQGIIEKLDYICNLGCNALWINPCFKSPFGDAGYDVADFYSVAPRYGTNEDLRRLFDEAHRRDMHVLLDLVPGHTSVEHPWFKESMKAERNEYTDRYVWTDSVWEEPQGIGCIRGISERDGSCAINFFSNQPALNYGFLNPTLPWQQPMDAPGPRATLEELKNIMRFWLSMGCDGFRVDMAGSLVKHDTDSRGTIRLWQEIRTFLDAEFPAAAMVSEWGEPDKSLQGGFHMDFLLHFGSSHYNDLFRCAEPFFSQRGKGDVSAFVQKYLENYEKSERKGLICIPSGNHDMDRLARSIQGDNLKIAFAFLLSMPGAPFIYYGDEIGMRYIENIPSVEGGYGRTGSRSPMQWGVAAMARTPLFTAIRAMARDSSRLWEPSSSSGRMWQCRSIMGSLRFTKRAGQCRIGRHDPGAQGDHANPDLLKEIPPEAARLQKLFLAPHGGHQRQNLIGADALFNQDLGVAHQPVTIRCYPVNAVQNVRAVVPAV